MPKRLFFICPTDHLETYLNNKFTEESFYYTSLGNSVKFKENTVQEINNLIIKKGIDEITFVLSNENKIVNTFLHSPFLHNSSSLFKFGSILKYHQTKMNKLWKAGDSQSPVLSNLLKSKIQALQPHINKWIVDDIKINAKIYYKKDQTLCDINTDLFNRLQYNLN